jgi:hypothetical protein
LTYLILLSIVATTAMSAKRLRPELPRLPKRMAHLPVDRRGYPVPWFVARFDGEPDFRVSDPVKFARASQERRCWVCGQPLTAFGYFVLSVVCAVDRVATEPPAHEECALFSAKACPFLARPAMHRREAGLPANTFEAAGAVVDSSPGVVLVWGTLRYTLAPAERGYVFRLGEPASLRWFATGQPASREDVIAASRQLFAELGRSADSVRSVLSLFDQTSGVIA